MLQINGKTFMNLQEAVQWLLDNNALPFQSTANYAGNTEIGLGTIVNPSPAKVRIGSLIFFADSKVSTVTGLTENGFIVSDQYNDLVDDVVYVSNVALNASGHLIVSLSNGTDIDAGLIKQITSFSINASQHLIATYNDSSSTDLGAIFTGNVNIAGNLTADSIIENMSGYSFTKSNDLSEMAVKYAGVVKTGNKITFVLFFDFVAHSADPSDATIGKFILPASVLNALYPYGLSGYDVLEEHKVQLYDAINNSVEANAVIQKEVDRISFSLFGLAGLTENNDYICRIESTFLLSPSLAS